ncbi:MAG: phosphoglucosamine mutase [Candidatus Thorarchaeota archaeon]|jgi:phosphoglucosamine mutase|nr:phosphoglucosamine mutase [Candidatus Thorarchaeota archaeon]
MAGKLFGTTGVRKVYGTEFKLDMAIELGKALGTYLGSGTVLLAHDARTTSPMVEDALAAGIMSTGVNVVRAGLVPTPTLAFMTKYRGYATGVMVTASHNPPEYTGLKFWSNSSMGYTQAEEARLEEIYNSKEYQIAEWNELGTDGKTETAVDRHISEILAVCDANLIRSRKFKVVVDPGNGAGCVLTPYLMRELGCKIVTINGQADGHFPGRRSEPDEESLGDLVSMIKMTGADFGIAHDGDADRVVFVTESGEVVRGDRVIALIASYILKSSKNKTIVTTVDSSRVLDETVKAAGGETVRTPVGDIQVAIKMQETDAVFGGEACGVFIHPEFHEAPDPFLTSCRILELMAKTTRSFADLMSEIPIYPLLKAKVKCPNNKKEAAMKEIAKALPKAMKKTVDILTVDGLGVFLEEGWVLVRPSGTEPVIRVTCEAPTQEVAKSIMLDAKGTVERIVESS